VEGYDVITSDGSKAGRVVGTHGDSLVVEQGTLRKTRHLLPKTFTEVDEAENVVRATLTKDVIEDSPKLDGDDVDERAVAEHYGLASGFAAPETEGYGDVRADDPGRSAEQDELRLGIETAEQERVDVQTGGGEARDHDPPSPGLLGDRNPR
jgi:hypothetical protein